MIGKITFCRVEPCFMADKPACGDVSRVKKDTNAQNPPQIAQLKNNRQDTFTSSKDAKDVKKEPVKTDKEPKKQD